MMLCRIVAPHFVAGFVTNKWGYVCEAAPIIIKYLVKRKFESAKLYISQKRWKLEIVRHANKI